MKYEKPEMEVMKLPGADIFTLSGDGDGDDTGQMQRVSNDWL